MEPRRGIKVFASASEAISDVFDGATIMVSGFAQCGAPQTLVKALQEKGIRNITFIANGVGVGRGLDLLCESHQVKKIICAFPFLASRERVSHFEKQCLAGEVELELVPMGTFAERIRAGGAGLGGFYTPTGVGTVAAEGKEHRIINGREYVLELSLRADFALVHAYRADALGNLVFRGTARNYNPIMATAAQITIAEAEEILETGQLDPEAIVTPSIYVDRIVHVGKRKNG